MGRFLICFLPALCLVLLWTGCTDNTPIGANPQAADSLLFPPDNHPPGAPHDPAPAVGALGLSRHPVLAWKSGGDLDGDILNYFVRVDTLRPPRGPGQEVGPGTACTLVSTLQPGKRYYWVVDARDRYGSTTSGPEWSFTTWPGDVKAPHSPSPVDGASEIGANVSLGWIVEGPIPVNCSLFLGTTNPPERVATQKGLAAFQAKVLPGSTYFWKVVATTPDSVELSSPIWRFTTAGAPSPPTGEFSFPLQLHTQWVYRSEGFNGAAESMYGIRRWEVVARGMHGDTLHVSVKSTETDSVYPGRTEQPLTPPMRVDRRTRTFSIDVTPDSIRCSWWERGNGGERLYDPLPRFVNGRMLTVVGDPGGHAEYVSGVGLEFGEYTPQGMPTTQRGYRLSLLQVTLPGEPPASTGARR